jgi:adenosylcobinamide-GDP ribazoletransferase
VDWTRDNTCRAIYFLPVVGLFPALALLGWQWICVALGAQELVFGAIAAVLPVLLTGGIHMDGFLDTADALASRQSRERKLEIMKDPHIGAFGTMACGMQLLVSFGLYTAVYQTKAVEVVALGFLLSRCMAACTSLFLPNARKGGMLDALSGAPDNLFAPLTLGLAAFFLGCCMLIWALHPGGVSLGFSLCCFFWYCAMTKRQFGGITGDTSGFFIMTCELALLFGAWLGGLL